MKNRAQGWITRFLGRFGFMKMPSGIGGFSGGGLLGFSGLGSARKQVEAYRGHVYKCVTVIYRRAISVPFKLYKERGDEDEELKRHPFLELMKEPNPYMTGRELKAMTFMHRDLTGKAFWLMVFNGLGRPAEIWPLPVGNFSRFVFNDAGTELLGYEFNRDTGGQIVYRPEEVVYFRYPHPVYFMDGASPIQAMAHAYDTDLALRVYQRNFFQNSARPDVVFETDNEIQVEDAKRLLLSWKQAHQGAERAWEPAILDKGLKINKFSATARDFEFAALAGWTKEDILEAYNVPEGKLGSVKDVNRANSLGIDVTFNSECISPRLNNFEDPINIRLLPLYDTGLYIEHVGCIPRDMEHDLKERESNLKNKATTVNEEREKMGLDAVPWGNVPWVGINEMQYGESLEIVQETANGTQINADKGRIEDKKVRRLEDEKGRRDRVRAGHERRVAAWARVFRAALRKFFRSLKNEVLENLEREFRAIEGITAGMSIKKVRKWLDEHKDEVDRISFNMAAANTELVKGAGPYIEATLIAGGEEALAGVGATDVIFDIFSPQASGWMGDKLKKIKDINRVTHDQLEKTIRAGFEAGESMPKIAARVRKVFDHADKVRSLRIAQTEVQGAVNFGSLEGYRQSGVVEGKEWAAGPDARETHLEAERTYSGDGAIPLHEDFQVGMGRGPAPGNIGLAEEDINCRCAILPVVRKE